MSTHRKAVETAVRAAGDYLGAADEPLVELARTLADQMDAASEAGPGSRLAGTYLTTLRTLRARVGVVGGTSSSSKLGRLRSIAGGDA